MPNPQKPEGFIPPNPKYGQKIPANLDSNTSCSLTLARGVRAVARVRLSPCLRMGDAVGNAGTRYPPLANAG